MKLYIHVSASGTDHSPLQSATEKVLTMLLQAELTPTLEDADVVLAEDPTLLMKALRRGKRAGQLCWNPRATPAVGLEANPEFADRFRIFRGPLPDVIAIAAWVTEGKSTQEVSA